MLYFQSSFFYVVVVIASYPLFHLPYTPGTIKNSVGIAMAVSSGDPAPLVGHNAFLRWSAVKEVSWVDKADGERKFWSEKHVSEDFDLALRLQARGYIGRYCTYTGDGFQEGVSLTAADEVIRLRKYAYGSCEIMLNQFKVRHARKRKNGVEKKEKRGEAYDGGKKSKTLYVCFCVFEFRLCSFVPFV